MRIALTCGFFLLFVTGVFAQNTPPLYSYQGSGAFDSYGFSVAAAGADANMDGFPDWEVIPDYYGEFLIGAPQIGSSPSQPGYAELRNGKNGNLIWKFTGDANNDQFGACVAAAGDVDLDGIADVMVGAPRPNGTGYVRVFSGSTGQTLYTIKGTPYGSVSGDQIGTSLTVGFVNNDAYPDFIIGIPNGNNSVGVKSGKVIVVSGANGALLYSIGGATSGEQFGCSVASAGDLDSDGLHDFIVGVKAATPSLTGRVDVISGATGTKITSLYGNAPNDRFGSVVSNVGYVDSDSIPDFAVGAPQTSALGIGYANIYSGANLTPIHQISNGTKDLFGSAISNAGWLDGDSIPEIAISAIGANLLSYVNIYSGSTGALLKSIVGNPGFGRSIAGVGEINYDGFADLLVGTVNPSIGAQKGSADVFALTPPGVNYFGTGTPGCDGTMTMSINSTPISGQSAVLRCFGTPNEFGSLSLGLIGNVSSAAGIDPFGLGVLLHVDLLASAPMSPFDMYNTPGLPSGVAITTPFSIPPGLTGTTFYLQTLSYWPSATSSCGPSPFGLSSSRGLQITVQ